MQDSNPGTPNFPQYPALLAAAQARHRKAGGFVNPAQVYAVDEIECRRGSDWVMSILGRRYGGARTITLVELHLVMVADEHGVCPPLPAAVLEARARHERETAAKEAAAAALEASLEAEWRTLQAAMPVAVAAVHNYKSARHCENGYVQGSDHIVVQEDLMHGRLRRRKGQALCENPSYAKNLMLAFPDGDSDGSTRRPTCVRCIRSACTITGLTADVMLGQPSRRGAGMPNRKFVAGGQKRRRD